MHINIRLKTIILGIFSCLFLCAPQISLAESNVLEPAQSSATISFQEVINMPDESQEPPVDDNNTGQNQGGTGTTKPPTSGSSGNTGGYSSGSYASRPSVSSSGSGNKYLPQMGEYVLNGLIIFLGFSLIILSAYYISYKRTVVSK